MRKPLLKASKLLSLASASGDDRAAPGDNAPATSSDGAPDTLEDADASTIPNHDDLVISGDDATSIPRDADPATPRKTSSVAPGFRTLVILSDEAPLPAAIFNSTEIRESPSFHC